MILHEGINEAGSTASFTAVGSSYATHGEPMIPIYIFYSMFGFQRTGDGFWAAADQMTRGFVLGATAGRTTLNGEGLQHEDGHSLLLAHTNPAVVSYDPAFSYEVAHITKDALRPDVRRGPGRPAGRAPLARRHVLPDRLQRAVQPAGRAGEPRRPGPARRHVPLRRGPAARTAPKAQILASGRRGAVGAAGAGAAGERLERLGRRVVGDLLGRAAPAGRRGGRAQPAAPRGGAAGAVRHRAAAGRARARSSRCRTGCGRSPT